MIVPLVQVQGVQIEYRWFQADASTRAAPTLTAPIIMLHEGLGSVSLWKEFPQLLAEACGRDVLAYSREGYGHSTPLHRKREVDYLHVEALEVLPNLREALGVRECVLFGHSDGASIALIHAGAMRWPVSGCVVLAPHLFVEDISVQSIARARTAYFDTDLKERLSRHHDDTDSAFWGWCDIWLDERFRSWNIEDCLSGIQCPVLAIQGEDDEYGTMEQIHRLVRGVEMIEVVKLAQCGHSSHRDQGPRVLEATREFLANMP